MKNLEFKPLKTEYQVDLGEEDFKILVDSEDSPNVDIYQQLKRIKEVQDVEYDPVLGSCLFITIQNSEKDYVVFLRIQDVLERFLMLAQKQETKSKSVTQP